MGHYAKAPGDSGVRKATEISRGTDRWVRREKIRVVVVVSAGLKAHRMNDSGYAHAVQIGNPSGEVAAKKLKVGAHERRTGGGLKIGTQLLFHGRKISNAVTCAEGQDRLLYLGGEVDANRRAGVKLAGPYEGLKTVSSQRGVGQRRFIVKNAEQNGINGAIRSDGVDRKNGAAHV